MRLLTALTSIFVIFAYYILHATYYIPTAYAHSYGQGDYYAESGYAPTPSTIAVIVHLDVNRNFIYDPADGVFPDNVEVCLDKIPAGVLGSGWVNVGCSSGWNVNFPNNSDGQYRVRIQVYSPNYDSVSYNYYQYNGFARTQAPFGSDIYEFIHPGDFDSTVIFGIPPKPQAPPQPTITLPSSSCITEPLTGNEIGISWTNPSDPVIWADISQDSSFSSYSNKSVSGVTSTTAPGGFSNNLTIQPDITYYVRLYNGVHSPTTSFTIPLCRVTLSLKAENRGLTNIQLRNLLQASGIFGTGSQNPVGNNWYNPMRVSLNDISSFSGGTTPNQYYMAFYKNTITTYTEANFLTEAKKLKPDEGFLLAYGTDIKIGEINQYYVWDENLNDWKDITTVGLAGYRLCSNLPCVEPTSSNPGNIYLIVYPNTARSASWEVRFNQNFGTKNMTISGMARYNNTVVGFSPTLTPSP